MNIKKINLMILAVFSYSVFSDLPLYSAKYNFESDEISITGIRELVKEGEIYELKFSASNLIASLYFSSKFKISKDKVIPESYDIKIRPKFLDRDQSLKFNYLTKEITSIGSNEWVSPIGEKIMLDPLNVQIKIRKQIKSGMQKFDLKIVDMENGGSRSYNYNVVSTSECVLNLETYNCIILERTQDNNLRKVTYYLAKELDFMFIKIIDVNQDKTNRLEIGELLSFG